MLVIIMKDNFPASTSVLGITLPVCNTDLCTRNLEKEVIINKRTRKYIGERKQICVKKENKGKIQINIVF